MDGGLDVTLCRYYTYHSLCYSTSSPCLWRVSTPVSQPSTPCRIKSVKLETCGSAPQYHAGAEEAAFQPGPDAGESSATQASSFTLAQFNELYRNDSLFSLGSSAYALSEIAAGEDSQDLGRLSCTSRASAPYDLLSANNHACTDTDPTSNGSADADTAAGIRISAHSPAEATLSAASGASAFACVQHSTQQQHQPRPIPSPFSTPPSIMALTRKDRRTSSPADFSSPSIRDYCTSPTTPWSDDAPSLPLAYSLTLTHCVSCELDATPSLSSFQAALRSAISSLMQHGVSFAVMPEVDYAAVVDAAVAADPHLIETLLRERPVRFAITPEAPLQVTDDQQQQQQPLAAASGWNASVLDLLRSPFRHANTSPRSSFTDATTALETSAAAVDLLITGGSNLHILSASELSRLQTTAGLRNTASLIEMLCTPEALPHEELGGGRMEREACMRRAAGLGNVTWLLQLLTDKVDVNSTEEGSLRTPLMQAAASGSLQASALLLNHGAFSQLKDRAGEQRFTSGPVLIFPVYSSDLST